MCTRALLKWAGGKDRELQYVLPLVPDFKRYYEPFVGGGAVLFSIAAQESFVNDKSSELMALYQMIQQDNNEFFYTLYDLASRFAELSRFVDAHRSDILSVYDSQDVPTFLDQYGAILDALFFLPGESSTKEIRRNLFSKVLRMKRLEREKGLLCESDVVANIEGALKSAFYMHVRYLYNTGTLSSGVMAALFYFVREYAYASMFRYNASGHLNVPYGGISYNRKNFERKIAYLESAEVRCRLSSTVLESMDFEEFFAKHTPKKDDFLFIDPPYDTIFSTYSKNVFGQEDQRRLANYLRNTCQAKFLMIAKNTPMIQDLYSGLPLYTFSKKYLVTFQGRNDQKTEHLVITNY